MASTDPPGTLFPCRFALPNGEQMVLPCRLDQTFGDVKEQIWSKKGFEANKKSKFVFRLKDGEVFFPDTATVKELLSVQLVFRELVGRSHAITHHHQPHHQQLKLTRWYCCDCRQENSTGSDIISVCRYRR